VIPVVPTFDSLLAPYSTLNSRRVSVSFILAERVFPKEATASVIDAMFVP